MAIRLLQFVSGVDRLFRLIAAKEARQNAFCQRLFPGIILATYVEVIDLHK